MVEYALLVAETVVRDPGTLSRSAELWLSRINWQVVGYAALALVVLRIASLGLQDPVTRRTHPWRVTCTTA